MFFPVLANAWLAGGDSDPRDRYPRSQTLTTNATIEPPLNSEKGNMNGAVRYPDVRIRQEPTIDEDEDDQDQDDNENDDDNNTDLSDPLSPSNPRRLRRLSSATALTSFSTSITLSSTAPPTSLWARFKKLINPETPTDTVNYIPNFRYTPIVSGIIIPFSILLEIPGLTEHWYIRTEQNKTVETRKNPAILNVGLALSLTCAVIANAALVVRFLERKVKRMTIMCVVFLSIHDLINITAVTIFGVEHRFDDGFTYGQSFWITVCSTIASTLTNLTLIVDLIRTPNFAKSGSGLTRKQRSLVIITIVLLSYIALGALINGLLMHLSFIDGLYFTVCSIETIGFGDIDPVGTAARIWVCLYSAIGIINLGVAVGMTRETVLEALEVGYRKRVRALRQRRREARRHRKIEAKWREAVEDRLRAVDAPIWVRAPRSRSTLQNALAKMKVWDRWLASPPHGVSHHWRGPKGLRLNFEALSAEALESAAAEAGCPLKMLLPADFVLGREGARRVGDDQAKGRKAGSNTHARVGRMAGILTRFAFAVYGAGENVEKENDVEKLEGNGEEKAKKIIGNGELEKEREGERKTLGQTFDTMRTGIEEEERRAFYARVLVAWILFVLFWFIGSAIFMATEKWEYGTAMYFCFIAFTTIGYGDYSPQTPAGRSVFVVWALLGVGTMTILISVLSEAYSSRYKRAVHAGAFDKAVKRYRQRTREKREKVFQNPMPFALPFPADGHSSHYELSHLRAKDYAQERLEALPAVILGQTRALHDHIQFFMSGRAARELPKGLERLLDDIAGAAKIGPQIVADGDGSRVGVKMGSKVRQEVLRDEEARQTLFSLSIETSLRKLMGAAEEVVDALSERDRLAAAAQQQRDEKSLRSVDINVEDETEIEEGCGCRDSPGPTGESDCTAGSDQPRASVPLTRDAGRQNSVTFHHSLSLR